MRRGGPLGRGCGAIASVALSDRRHRAPALWPLRHAAIAAFHGARGRGYRGRARQDRRAGHRRRPFLGGVASLEGALLQPANLAGLMLYEPPVHAGTPAWRRLPAAAEAALARRRQRQGTAASSSATSSAFRRGDARRHALRRQWRAGWEYMITLLPNQMEDNRAIRGAALTASIAIARSTCRRCCSRGTDQPEAICMSGWPRCRGDAYSDDRRSRRARATTPISRSPQLVADAIAAFAAKLFGAAAANAALDLGPSTNCAPPRRPS